jgi:hypothetical protein
MNKKFILTATLFFVFVHLSQSQEIDNLHKIQPLNIVRNIVFVSQDKYIPLTVMYSPYGYWEFCKINFGLRNFENIEILREISFYWEENEVKYKTPSAFNFDTLKIDTIFSIFKNSMSVEYSLQPTIPKKDTISVNINKVNQNLLNEFKFTYLLKGLYRKESEKENIKILYSNISKNGFINKFYLIDFKLMTDTIMMISSVINVINLYEIKIETKDSVFITGKQHKRLVKKIARTNFNNIIDWGICNGEPIIQTSFMVDYVSENFQRSFFLCDDIFINDREQMKTINYLQGLKNHTRLLNNKYFRANNENQKPAKK